MIGKFTLGLLSISDQQFRRDDVLDLLSSAPIRLNPDSSELIPDVAWARRARAARSEPGCLGDGEGIGAGGSSP